MLSLFVLERATLVGLAVDTASPPSKSTNVVAVAKHSVNVKIHGIETTHVIKMWLRIVKLNVADDKTGVVLIINCKKSNTVKIRTGNHEVISKSINRYRG